MNEEGVLSRLAIVLREQERLLKSLHRSGKNWLELQRDAQTLKTVPLSSHPVVSTDWQQRGFVFDTETVEPL